MRQIVLDTETTGLDPVDGHRIIEIGCVELVNRKLTGNRYHVYLNPERDIDAGAVAVHGLDNRFLQGKPTFSQIAGDFIEFVENAELVIHNAPFDVGFINAELQRLKDSQIKTGKRLLSDYCEVLDTLALAKKKHPGQRNSLDALCKRYNVNNSHRELHGALLDAEILAEVYLAMTGGQAELLLEPSSAGGGHHRASLQNPAGGSRPKLPVKHCTAEELALHEARLDAIEQSSGGPCVWRRGV